MRLLHKDKFNGTSIMALECTNNTSDSNQATKMKTMRHSLQYTANLCLAVILSVVLKVGAQVEAQQQELGGSNQQLVAHASSSHLAHSQSSLFKDLSGPTSGKIQTLDVICGKNFMTVRAEFSGPFYGIVFSKGTYGQENCIYVKPNSGLTHAAFNVYYDQCGTKPDLQGKFYENTIVIQYGSDIIEAYDEAKRLRCEWFEAYEKPATFKPAIPVADLEVVEMNFQGDDIDCWMEIQEGSGPWSREVSKIVPVGQPMTIVVAINDYNGQFDMRVKSCVAHDGIQSPIALTDEFGCVLRPKMLTPFTKIKNPGGHKKATVLSYSRFLAFKFPDSMTVQIQCTVEVCRHGCADACQRVPSIAATTLQPELSLTARWPAQPNQPALAIDGPSRIVAGASVPKRSHVNPQPTLQPEQNSYKPPARVQFSPPEVVGQRLPQYPQRIPDQNLAAADDMSGSDSQLANSVANFNGVQINNRANSQQHRRIQPAELPEPRYPQYIPPQTNSNRRQHFQRTPTTSTSTTLAPTTTQVASVSSNDAITTTTTTTTTTTVAVPDSSRQPDELVDNSQSPDGNRDNIDQTRSGVGEQHATKEVSMESSSDSSSADQKPEASQVKPSIAVPEQSSASNSEPNADQQQQAPAESSKPSVQGEDQLQDGDNKAGNQQDSSLKTVEVEIPANEEPSTLIATSTQQQQPQFSSNRVSNVLLNSNSAQNGYQDKPNGYDSQMRDERPRDDKGDESNIEAIMAHTSKSRFGARSQPQSSGVHINEQHLVGGSYSNHQPVTSVDEQPFASGSGTSGSFNKDDNQPASTSLLIDRSDDSSLVTELQSSVDQPSIKVAPADSLDVATGSSDENSSSSLDSNASGSSVVASSKVKPVVGTEELATGPLQLEDRIGSQPDTLEEALLRLQQQIPQTAALVSEASKSVTESTQANSEQKLSERADKSPSVVANEERTDRASQLQQQSKQQQSAAQPYPNVIGQAKVLPDPNSALSSQKSPSLVQASSDVVASSVVLPSGAQPQASVQPTVQPAQQPMNSQKPVADPKQPVAMITNVPISLGFPQSQLPAVQQISQQLFYQQQQAIQQQQQQQLQAQQQQQSQQKQVTAKPPRGRFSLLSPQAALQAVASRFLPNKQKQQQQQQQQQMPNLLKMIPEQQQKLIAASQQQQQAPMQNYIISKPNAQQQQPSYNQMPNRFVPPQQQQQQQPQPQPQQPVGLFGRFGLGQQQQQPLVRSRRSAIIPNGRRGNGELGMTKTFMVVTGLDLAFAPNSTETELPPILKGRRGDVARVDYNDDADVIYGVCMPVVSFTFVLTCIFWLIVFIFSFCVYMLMKARGQSLASRTAGGELSLDDK